MNRWIIISVIIQIMFLFTLSCFDSSGSGSGGYSETFDDSDRPGIEYNTAGDYFLVKPWNYEKDYNSSRKYPLLIYLHGSSQTKYLKNLYYMGMGYYTWDDTAQNMTEEYKTDVADEFRKTYPCFMYVPQGPSGWDISKLISQIEQLKTDYRIDTKRIYLHGFSMGGSGSFRLANQYYQFNGQLFAAIIILSGGHQTLSDAIVEKTALWTHAGCDQASDLSGANNTYSFLKNHALNTGCTESEKLNYMIGETPYQHTVNTMTLTKNGREFAKKSEYPGVGHFTTCFPFDDPEVFEWMFSKSL